MKIYLDVCAIQRPLDTANQLRIMLESEAVLGILSLCENGQIELISSDALRYEISCNPMPIRKEFALTVLSKAQHDIKLSKRTRLRAEKLVEYGLKPMDALHIALAEAAKASYFCTCDDRLLRKAKQLKELGTKVVSPIEFVEEIEK
ncbi:MAG: PIN domain-containing protein [candidate division KSB1 bacterium]|nr:PIN domain-containing protein [candidate division KSB1 bacterium]MDQ7066483.1 PIN domain-containing protein [candidate division KSB1 bacterium]